MDIEEMNEIKKERGVDHLEIGDQVKFKDMPSKVLIYGDGVLWELVPSGEVGSSFKPDMPVMIARWVIPNQKEKYSVGHQTEDYFQASFDFIDISENLEFAIEYLNEAHGVCVEKG